MHTLSPRACFLACCSLAALSDSKLTGGVGRLRPAVVARAVMHRPIALRARAASRTRIAVASRPDWDAEGREGHPPLCSPWSLFGESTRTPTARSIHALCFSACCGRWSPARGTRTGQCAPHPGSAGECAVWSHQEAGEAVRRERGRGDSLVSARDGWYCTVRCCCDRRGFDRSLHVRRAGARRSGEGHRA
jgi:hypothetical protein